MRLAFITIILAVSLLACAPSHSTGMPVVDFASSITPSSTPVPEITTSHIVPSSTSTNVALVRNTPSPRPTKTRTPIPTFTPATPPVKQNESYTLREWTPAQADLLVDQIASYLMAIENESEYAGVYGYSYYMEQYKLDFGLFEKG